MSGRPERAARASEPRPADAPEHIVDLLVARHIAGGGSSRVALIDDDRRWTYGELGAAVDGIAGELLAREIAPGDHVAVLVAEGLESVAAWLGAMRAGGVAVLMNPLLPADHYAALLAKSRPRFALVSAAAEARLAAVLASVPTRLVVETAALRDLPDRCPHRGADDPAFALFTSGTTGTASCVVHRHRDVAITSRDYGAEILALDADDVTFSPSPLYFAYGLNSVHLALCQGGTAVLPPATRRPAEILALIERHRPTIFFAVPTVYRMILAHPGTPALPSIRLCVSAGESLPGRIFDAWRERFGHAIVDGIGTTEALSTFVSNRPGELRPGSTGKVVRGFEVRLMTEDLAEAAPGQEGVLWVRGPTIVDGYLADPDRTAERFQDGWFVTNDVFRRDRDGFLHYAGRVGELVKVGGVWVAPGDLEDALRDHALVEDCAVVYRLDDWGLTRPHAFVVLRPGADPDLDWQAELKQLCRQRDAGAAYPHFVELVAALPRTPSGKVERYKLRTLVSARETSAT